MTTLPQNPTMQFQRPAATAAQAGAAPPPGGGLTSSDIVRVLRSNMWLIIVLTVVAGAIGYVVNMYLAKNHSRYTAKGTVQLDIPQTATLQARGGMSDQALLRYQQTAVNRLRHESAIEGILTEESPIRETSWFASMPSANDRREDLAKNLSIVPVPDTMLIQVSMTYAKPEDAKKIVEAYVDRFLREQGVQSRDRELELRTKYQQRREIVSAELNQQKLAREAAQRELTAKGVSLEGSLRLSTRDAEVDAANRDLIDAQANVTANAAALESIQKQLGEGQEPTVVVRAAESDQEYAEAKRLVTDSEYALDELKRLGYLPESKEVKRAQDRVAERTKNLEDKRKELVTKYRVTVQTEYTARLEASKGAMELARQKVERIKSEQSELQKIHNAYRTASEQEQSLQVNRQEIQSQIDEINNGSAQQIVVFWADRPVIPPVPSFPKLSATMTAALTVGVALALLIAFARELLDQTIRSPRDLSRVGNIALLGTVPHEDDDPQASGARLAIAEAPASMTAENLRQLRTRLQHQGNLDTMRSLLVTSPNPGDGKTTVVSNLAAGLALAGRKILLVDANFRRPELHKLFAVDDKDGFAVALTAPENLATLAKSTKVPNLSVLPAGAKPANATELLESPLLSAFIDKALESYDHVLFDSGPLLFASETVSMAPRVDGVVTVVKARASTRGVLARVKDTLRQIKANSLGVVINGIRAYGGGYYSRNIRTYYEYSNSK